MAILAKTEGNALTSNYLKSRTKSVECFNNFLTKLHASAENNFPTSKRYTPNNPRQQTTRKHTDGKSKKKNPQKTSLNNEETRERTTFIR